MVGTLSAETGGKRLLRAQGWERVCSLAGCSTAPWWESCLGDLTEHLRLQTPGLH